MTPYELRFEIFKQSYNMLNDEFCVKYDTAREWNQHIGKQELEYPAFPSLGEVLERADIINNFVSDTK
jgi:hypothetical protein